jgi:outer membrane murein-binding lipoprotein Lpp
MIVYLSKDERSMTPSMTAAHATATRLTARLENMVHKLYISNFF